MRIEYLADHEELVPELANWHFAEWSFLQPNETLEGRTLRLRRCCGHNEIPTVVIGLLGNELCGSGMLVAQDMDSRPKLTFWLAGLYVASAHRRKGYGAKLIERIVRRPPFRLKRFTSTRRVLSSTIPVEVGRLWSAAIIEALMCQSCRGPLPPNPTAHRVARFSVAHCQGLAARARGREL